MNTFATSNQEIGEMLKRSSAAMNAANNSLEETIALESAAVQITRNAETTGTAFRTISMRIRGYDEETEEFIGNVEQLEGDIADLTKTTKNSGGISLFTDETKSTYKSTYQLLKEISGIWDDLSDKQQAGLLEKLAGKRGGQVLAGILDDFSEVERAMNEMLVAEGSADKEMSIIEESWEYKLNNLKQTWVGFLQDLIDRGVIADLLDQLTELSEALIDMMETNPEGFVIFATALIGLTRHGGISSLVSDFKNLSKVFTSFVAGATDSASALAGLSQAGSLSVGAAKAGEAFSGLAASLGMSVGALSAVVAGFAAVGAAIGIAVYECNKANNELQKSAKKLGQEYSSTKDDLEDYKTEIGRLQETLNDSNTSHEDAREARIKLLEIQDELIAKYGDESDKIQMVTDAINGQIDALDRLSAAEWQETMNEFNEQNLPGWDWGNRLAHGATDNIDVMLKELEESSKSINLGFISEDLRKQLKQVAGDQFSSYIEGDTGSTLVLEGSLEDVYDTLLDIQQIVNKDTDPVAFNRLTDAATKAKDTLKQYGEFYDQYVLQERIFKDENLGFKNNEIESAYLDYLDKYKSYQEAYADNDEAVMSKRLDELYKLRQDLDKELTEKVASGDISPQIKESIIRSFADLYPELQAQLDQMEFKINTPSLKQLDGSISTDDILKDLSEGGTTANERIFNHILEQAEEAGIVYGADAEKVQQLLDLLVQWGVIQEGITDEVEDTTDAWSESVRQAKFKELDVNEEEFKEYLDVFKELNPELAEYEDKCEQAALEQYAFDQSVEDLRSHLNDYIENLETLDESSVEYANSIQSITDDLSRLTGIDLSITDAQSIIQDTNNLELLRQALDGDNDALNRLRANVAQGLYIKANAVIDTEEFNTQYNELANWIAEHPDLGTLEAQSFLDTSPFVKNCIELVKQGKMTADQLKAMFATLGWHIDFSERTEYLKLPKVNLSGNSYRDYAMGKGKKAGYTSSWDGKSYVDVPVKLIDNIKFVDNKGYGSSRPTVTAPTSSSGANYKPEQKKGSGSGGSGGGGGGGSDKAKDDEEELEDTYDEFFDYFERRVKVVTDAISLLDAHLENVVGSKAKNKLLDAQERLYRMQQQEYADAKDMYQEMADNALAEIPDDLKDDVLNGAVAIDEFIGKGNEEVVNAINDYTKWADKVSECKQKLAELKEELRQLELKRFQNIAQDWQDLFDLRQNNAIDLISKQIDLFEEAGELIGKNFYEEQRNQASKQYDLLKKEREALIAELNRGLSNGTIEKGTDEWLEMVNTLSDLEGSILDCAKAIEEFDNAILQLHVDVFERIQNQFDDFDDQLSDMADFLDDEKVSDKYGEWSKEGLARAGLLTQQYELAQKQVHDYGEEIKWLNKQYEAGKYSTTEYMDRLADLNSKQRDYAQQAEDAKDAIIDLNKARVDIIIDGIEEEIDAYSKLIQKEKDALSAEKDLHEWRKQLADSTKAITDIEKQLAAMENDNSAAAIAKKKQLQQQLKEAQDNLAEQEYDHSITAQQDALDQQLEQYKEARQVEIDEWNAYLENISLVMSDTFMTVQENAVAIGETITQTAQEHGFKISEALTSAWQAGEGAIASYGETLSASTSAFIENLDGVEQKTLALQTQADATSQGLAQMFANRADNLVSELQRSWDSEANLENMTHALSDAFVEALDSGYRIGEVVAPMEAAKSATEAVGSAADSAASSFDNMGSSARRAGNEAQLALSKLNSYADAARSGIVIEGESLTAGAGSIEFGNIKLRHAKGLTKAQQDELAWTQELGSEMIVSPTRQSILTPIKKGDSVLTADMTKNLWELAKINPKDLVKGVGNVPSVQQTKAISVNFGSAIEIQGNVNDSLKMAQIASQEAQNKIAKTLKDLNDEMKY